MMSKHVFEHVGLTTSQAYRFEKMVEDSKRDTPVSKVESESGVIEELRTGFETQNDT